ncbi:MAG: hypothetical protein ACN4E2_04475 [Nitrospinota bacterium]
MRLTALPILLIIITANLLLIGCDNEKRVPPSNLDKPWMVKIIDENKTEVLGIVIGSDSAEVVKKKVKSEPKIAIFEEINGSYSLEAYYAKVEINKFSGELIANLEIDNEWAKKALLSKVKSKAAARKAKQYFLDAISYRQALNRKVIGLTFLPSFNLTEEIIIERFGKAQKIIELDDSRAEWLYPEKALFILLDHNKKDAIHYLSQALFKTTFPN